MNIRGIVDKMKTPFEKGQKLEKLYPAFNAFETFLFVPNHTSKSGSSHKRRYRFKKGNDNCYYCFVTSFNFWHI